ncbi:MAG: hypothetical protein NTW87_29835 [Planctomycetota bacterium]|nr:hypothetical protein [Planctomycetota bacterium]
MDRREWLTTVYREANLFLDRQSPKDGTLTAAEVDELEPELHQQLQEVLGSVDSLEDVIKHSLLRNPPPDLWYGEQDWRHVLVAVASACLLHDVKGVVHKIVEGVLPRLQPGAMLDSL